MNAKKSLPSGIKRAAAVVALSLITTAGLYAQSAGTSPPAPAAAQTAAPAVKPESAGSGPQAARPESPGRADGKMGHGEQRKAQNIEGTVEGFNYGPRGDVSSVVLRQDQKIAQLNFPPEMGAAISAVVTVGQKLQASGMPEVVSGDRAIYRLVSLTTADGKQYAMPRPGNRESQHVQGTVKQLNYSPRGELDGAILDSGDVVMVGPGGAAQLSLAVGQQITADGMGEPMFAGHVVVQANTVNGTEIPHPPQPHPGMGGPGMGGQGMGRPGMGGQGMRGPGMDGGGQGMRRPGGGPGMGGPGMGGPRDQDGAGPGGRMNHGGPARQQQGEGPDHSDDPSALDSSPQPGPDAM